MFAVTGTWRMDTARAQERAAALPQLVAGVAQNEGFVRGYWSQDVDAPQDNVTFIVFETLEQAHAFRAAVLANAPTQASVGVQGAGLRIVEVMAQA